ncbi:hypothetical protein GGQ84_001973 [Desulfitispora alkaliphila]|uniref:hypothetical protein n=1 Tax=Desulfitispora alkaliphila TaxID=622674 RepID=UPI003D240FDF
MAEHRGKLYMGDLPLMGQAEIQLFSSYDPERDGWEQVDVFGDPDKNPRGNVDLLLSYNDHLYVGAGDARNEHPGHWRYFKITSILVQLLRQPYLA